MKGSMTPVFVKLNFSLTTFSKYLTTLKEVEFGTQC